MKHLHALSLTIAFALASVHAFAGCGSVPSKSASQRDHVTFVNAAYRPAQFVLIDHDSDDPSIVGMWNFVFTGTDGKTVVDFGYQQWHSDGTEITNSGGHDPATGNWCMGVWASTGNRGFKLNHFALSYDKTTGMLAAVINIKEQVTVSHNGESMSGTFSLNVYPYDATTGTTASSPVQTVTGWVSATRVTVN